MLTSQTYFSRENQQRYMGSSQFKSFMNCEASALAEISGAYEIEPTKSMLIGSYVDAYFEGTLTGFQSSHPELFTRQGDLKSEYRQAEYIIKRIERDNKFMEFMSGEKQVIKTGYIEGIPFKIKIDSYHPGQSIVDLKIMKDFQPIWVEGSGRLNFIEAWGYDIQGAIYQYIEGNRLPFYIAAATKEKEPDIALIEIPQHYLDAAMEIVRSKVLRFQAIKEGYLEPERCGHCDYCKRTKILDGVMRLEELDCAE